MSRAAIWLPSLEELAEAIAGPGNPVADDLVLLAAARVHQRFVVAAARQGAVAAELRRMADLHPNQFGSAAIREAADLLDPPPSAPSPSLEDMLA